MSINKTRLLGLATGILVAHAAGSSAHASLPSCYSNPQILDCFRAYSTKLKTAHIKQLEKVATKVASRFRSGRPVKDIIIYGFGVYYKSTDPVAKNAMGRALNARAKLRSMLNARGLGPSKVRLHPHIGLDTARSGIGNGTRHGRALNRRVEITFVRTKPTKPKGCVDTSATKRLEAMPTSVIKNATDRRRTSALRNLLLRHYKHCRRIDDRYFAVDAYVEQRLLKTFAAKCKGKTGRALAICLNGRRKEIETFINYVGKELDSLIRVLGTLDVKKSDECKVGRRFLKRSGNKNSVYRPFKSAITGTFKYCV